MRRRRHRLLLNVIDGLPRNSHYGEALAMDTELAKMQQGQGDSKRTPRPPMRDWSPEVEVLAAIFDRMNAFIQTQSEKNLRLKPWPLPLTAKELVKQEKSRQQRTRLERLIAEGKQRAQQQQERGDTDGAERR